MGLVAEYELGCEALPLTDVAAAVPSLTLEVRMLPHAEGHSPFVVTVVGESPAAVEPEFEAAAFVGEYTALGEGSPRHPDRPARRYQVVPAVGLEAQLGDHLDDLSELRRLSSNDSVVDRIRVTPTGWIQTARFADRAAFDEFRAFWGRNATFRLRRLSAEGRSRDPGRGPTRRQREALSTAYEMGYFEVPRGASLGEVADELGISRASLSERLRRAQSQVVGEFLDRQGVGRQASAPDADGTSGGRDREKPRKDPNA